MDPLAEEQLDYGDDEFVGAQKLQYQGGGAISALADDDTMGEDDEYDDLYNDVNVGEGFLQLHRSEVPAAPVSFSNGVLHTQTADVQEPRSETGASQGAGIPGVSVEGRYSNSEGLYSDQQKSGIVAARAPEMGSVHESHAASMSQKGRVLGVGHDVQVQNMGLQGPAPLPQKTGVGPANISGKNANEPVPLLNTGPAGPRGPPQMPTNQTGINFHLNSSLASETPIQPPVDNGSTMLFVGELHWWTTDAELESVLSQYGRVKEIKFFDERASGKSKGYCQVEFYDSATAAACKEGMNGYVFNGRACVVAFASPQTLKQMGASYSNKSQAQNQPQTQGRRANDGAGRGNMNFQGGDSGRGYGRGGWGRGGQGVLNRGSGGGGPMRGRGPMGGKNMVGSNAGVGSSASGGGYGQGMAGPAFGGPGGSMMHPQGMMGGQFEPPYMGRGGGYGGFLGPTFPGMLPSFPAVNSMGLAGVAPHVNPAFFGRGMAANGMGMMGSTAMDGHQAGMWTDPSMGGWGGEEHGRGTRESSYGADDGGSEYGYGEAQHDKGVRSNATSREKDRGSERDWSGNMERRLREDKEQDWERSDREYRYRDERDGYRDHRQRERDSATENDRDRGQSSSRSRSRSRAVPEEDHRSRSRDVDYGKRRRLPSE